jgi:Mrp family chromosome partitioning ATPase
LSNQLAHTEAALRQAKAAAGVVSTVEDAKKERADSISAQGREINTTRAALAGHEAALRLFTKPVAPAVETTNATPVVATTTELPADVVGDYKELDAQLQQFLAAKRQTLLWATENSYPVQDILQQIKDVEQKKKALEAKYPRLTTIAMAPAPTSTTVVGAPAAAPAFDPNMEELQVRILTAQLELMNSKVTQLRQELAKIEASEALLTELQRKRDIEDTDYRFYENSLHQAKVMQTLEEGKLSNISVTQEPTPPFKDSDRIKKMCGVLAGGGFGAGIAIAVLLELFLNQTVRRPNEIETRLRLPLMLTIPDTTRRNFEVPGSKRSNGHAHALLKAPDDTNGHADESRSMEVSVWDNSHDLHLYFEALRDRLFMFFDANNLKHNPKLVAVTACAQGAGVSTIAAGLAATLSETGDGNVLLVDMNDGEGAARPFYKGKPAHNLEDALEDKKRSGAMVQNNLYVVAEGMNGTPFPNALPKQFTQMMPKLKASDYDFIIFDMPPVSQISVTPKMARMMDINLLIVESEKTDRDIVKQASSMISGSKANLGVVLNKKRSYVPQWLQQEL